MLPSLEYAEVPGLSPIDIVRHESPLYPLLQYQFRIVLQRGIFVDMTTHIRTFRIIVRCLLPQRHSIDQHIMAFLLLLRGRLILLVSLCMRVTLLLSLVLMNDEIHVFLYLIFRAHLS